MAQTYNGGGGGGSFDYFSSGTATKPAPFTQVPKAKPKRVSAPRRPAAPRAPYQPNNYGGGYGGGYSAPRSGKSVGSNSSGRIAKTAPAPPPKPAPKPMTPEQWIAKGGDTVYQQQRDALTAALNDYKTRSLKEGTDYGITNAANRKALQSEQGRSRQDLINDYVARGVIGGAQDTALADFDTDWTKRLGDFDTAYNNWVNDQATALSDYTTSNKNQLTKAQQDAIARRAASLT